VADFSAREIALAVADFDCQQSVQLARRQNDVQNELQQQFVNQHHAELEAWANSV